jgi:mRNA-degrading endonuclease toxin of MazEF toxin-antitoxin module
VGVRRGRLLKPRGYIFDVEGKSANTVGALVLTNNVWNRIMSGVAAVPVRGPAVRPPQGALRIRGMGWIDLPAMAHLPQAKLTNALYKLTPEAMDRVEDKVVEVLALVDLCCGDPLPPHSPPGAVTYPRWGDIYWTQGFDTGGQDKRYVVVSHDHHNAATQRPFLVRTTAPKCNAQDFPLVQGGAAHTCPGELRTAPSAAVEMRKRPKPDSLNVHDMAATAYGLVSTFELGSAIVRGGGELRD